MNIHEYALKVEAMRSAQRKTTALHRDLTAKPSARTAALDHSRKLERELDEITQAILSPAPMPELFTDTEN